MGDPIQNLSQVQLRDHPALEDFLLHIYNERHSLPELSEILVTNDARNDGIVDVSYLDEANHRIYAARLNGQDNSLYYNVGTLGANGLPTWRYTHRVPGEVRPLICGTIHTLGGRLEEGFNCPRDFTLADLGAQRRAYQFNVLLANWGALEIGSRIFRRGSFTRALFAGLRPVGTSEFTASQRLWQTAPGVGVGLAAMLGSAFLSDALGLDARAHPHERYALGVGMGHGANLLTNLIQSRGLEVERFSLQRALATGPLSRAYRLPPPETVELMETRLVTRRTIRPMGLASGLLSSALVDATLGQLFPEDSSERFALRATGFFLPQIFRSFMGERALALAERPRVAAVGRWGGRLLVAGFAADLAYMGINYFSNSSTESGRINMLYSRANEIQRHNQHPITAFFDGVAETIAPSLAQRYLVGDDDVEVARREFQNQSAEIGGRVHSSLRQLLLFNPVGSDTDPEFYRHIDWSLFRGENRLRNLRLPDGHSLPVADIYDQISDPEVYSRRIEHATPAEQVRYIREQFRGHHLSEADVREILGRIAIYRLRDEIAQLHFLDTPDHQPLLKVFDENGALRAGRETAFLTQLFPEAEQGEPQILALRQVALVNHLRALEAAGRSSELENYRSVARDLGLLDESGHWVAGGTAGEVVEQGLALFDRHPVTLAPLAPPSPRPSQRELLLHILHRSPGGSTPRIPG